MFQVTASGRTATLCLLIVSGCDAPKSPVRDQLTLIGRYRETIKSLNAKREGQRTLALMQDGSYRLDIDCGSPRSVTGKWRFYADASEIVLFDAPGILRDPCFRGERTVFGMPVEISGDDEVRLVLNSDVPTFFWKRQKPRLTANSK